MMKSILIADDDEGILHVLHHILKSAGYKVEMRLSGEEILSIKEDLPDLILLDIWMNGVDGREICRHLKSQASTHHIPIILLSANSDAIETALLAGADDFISKPFDRRELLQVVSKHG